MNAAETARLARFDKKAEKTQALLRRKYPRLEIIVNFYDVWMTFENMLGLEEDEPFVGTFVVTVVGSAGSFSENVHARLTPTEILKELHTYIDDLDWDSAGPQ